DVQAVVNKLDATRFSPELKLEITGRYKKKIDLQAEMKQDMGIASLVALSLVLAYLLLHFKRIEAIILIALPLIFGIICTFAFASLIFGQLNILTAFIGVILLGLGIDHGIHLLSRYRDEMHNGIDHSLTIFNTFISTGRSVAVAALTTFVIFLGLSFSEFRAFYEFGIIASAGMILIMASYLVLMPALLAIINRHTWQFSNTPKTTTGNLSAFQALNQLHTKYSLPVIFLSALLVLVAGYKITDLKFNYDFESLGNSNLPSFQLDKEVNELLGYSQTPMVALTNNLNEEYYVTNAFRENQLKLGEKSGVDFLLSTADLIPENQTDKEKVIQKMLKTISKVKDSWLENDDIKKLEELKEILKTKPFVYADLPIEIRQLFGRQSPSNTDQGAIMLFPAISLSDGSKVISLANELRQVRQQSGDRVAIAGESMILADILNLIFREAPKMLFLSLFLIFSILWFFLRKINFAMVALVPALFTIILTLGIMSILGLELNYINMVMIPILLGIGVDSGVHMVNRAIDGNQLEKIISDTGMAIFGSIVTSGLGLGALLLTNHPGLNSLAYIAILGLSINLIISIYVLPSLIQKYTLSSQQLSVHH
ncbi:MAG: MMPL family transporter, partial [Gammaproteobacteria bacterium]|nr:MMPL family transporter [Gammaproteobacteria bacterium]